MTSHNYYADPYRGSAYDRREDGPLPAVPPPSTSPFDDRTYGYSRPSYGQRLGEEPSYEDLHGRRRNDSDPFGDQNAVPLQGYNSKDASHMNATPILEVSDASEFIRDAKPSRSRRGGNNIDDVDQGWFKGRITWVCFTLSVIQLAVFLAEIIKNAILTKSPIEIHPQFNPMIGPSPYVLINMGARYVPCMHNMPGIQNATTSILWPCPNATSSTGDSVSCSLSDLCGFSGVPNPHIGGSINETPAPNQWFRFIIPIFIHAGIIHIGFNLLLQLTLGRDMERAIGSIRFTLVYFASGIFGFVLGGNFAATGIASTGCSGSLFGILALTLLDLLYTWRTRPSPIKDLLFILVDVVIAFILGLLPGLDNFSHIGGFLMGLVLGVCILHSPPALSRRIGEDEPPYDSVAGEGTGAIGAFAKAPVAFFRGRRPLWWAWWLLRLGALLGALIGFILLIKNFYVWRTGCSWCKYLSCLPVNNWCNVGNLQFTSTNTTKRGVDLLSLTHEAFGNLAGLE